MGEKKSSKIQGVSLKNLVQSKVKNGEVLWIFHSVGYYYNLSANLSILQNNWVDLNPNWHEFRKQEKGSSLAPPRSKFYKTQWGCQIIPIDLNFHLQKCLEIFDKNLADKIQSKNYKGGKSDLSHAG